MRKIIAILIMLSLTVFVASYAYAGSADARTASFGQGIAYVNGLGDLSTGNTAEVDSNGNVATEIFNNTNQLAIDSSGNAAVELFDGSNQVDIDADGALEVELKVNSALTVRADGLAYDIGANGATNIHSLILYGDASSTAGDYALVYDAATATGSPVFDISIDTAKGTEQLIIPGGVAFATDIYVDVIDSNVALTIIYGS